MCDEREKRKKDGETDTLTELKEYCTAWSFMKKLDTLKSSMPLCLLARDSTRTNSWELAQSAESKPQRLTAKYWGPRVFRPARFPHTDAALICCICCWSCWAILFCSLSFCVSANFTTMGDEQPYENTKAKGSNSSFWVKEKILCSDTQDAF